MSDLDAYSAQLRSFVLERGWDAFDNPRNLAMALASEAGELLELFQWLDDEKALRTLQDDADFRQKVSFELADILNYCLRLARVGGIDLLSAAHQKLAVNEQRYPATSFYDESRKYNVPASRGEPVDEDAPPGGMPSG